MSAETRRVIVTGLGLWLAATALGATPYHYMYFDEPRTLGLDTARIAVQFDGTVDPAALAAHGLDAQRLEPVAIPGWTMVATPAGGQDAADATALVATLAARDVFAFVSPVFIDSRGLPLLITRDLLIGFEAGVTPVEAARILAAHFAGEIVEMDFAGLANVYRVRSAARDGFDVLDAANTLAALPQVRFAEPDMIVRAELFYTPNDPLFPQQWALQQTNDQDMDAPEAWDITIGSPSVVVAILDCGIQQDHPDLNQIPGQDFTQHGTVGGGPYNACDNHGTCVAGCVAAVIDNNAGVVGVAPGCKVVSAKMGSVIEFFGFCTPFMDSQASYLANAINWVVQQGYDVTNSSFGYEATSTITTAYNNAYNAGIVHFAATGNDSSSTLSYPANLNTVLGVGALNSSGQKASFGTYGVGIAFSAPGEAILTTDRTGSAGYESGDTATVDGTSFASPNAAGVGALVLSQDPTLTPAQVEQIMNSTCVDLGTAGYDTTYGWGFVNARNAVVAATPAPQGACCHTDGSCTVATQAQCGGTWLGQGTTCTPNPCLPPVCAGDSNCDAVINWRDIDFFVAAMNDNLAAWQALFAPGAPTCAFANNDVNGDGAVSWRDIDPLVAVMNTICP